MGWRDWRHDIERQYNPRAGASDIEAQHERRRRLSEEARRRLAGEYDIRYGPGPRQLLDVYRAGNGSAPITVYLHGGYWRTAAHFRECRNPAEAGNGPPEQPDVPSSAVPRSGHPRGGRE